MLIINGNKEKELIADLSNRNVALDADDLKKLDEPDCTVHCMKQRKGGHEGKFGYWLDLTTKQYWESSGTPSKRYVEYSRSK